MDIVYRFSKTSILATLILLNTACTTLTPVHKPNNTQFPIHLIKHKWHTGIIIPKQALGELSFIAEQIGEFPYYEFAWGDRRFYQHPTHNAYLAARALFFPTKSVVHVAGLKTFGNEHVVDARTLPLAVNSNAIEPITTSFTFGLKKGEPQPINPGLYGESYFYASPLTYSMFYTCNNWTIDILNSGGLPLEQKFFITSGKLWEAALQNKNELSK